MMSVYLTRKGYTVTAQDSTEKAWAAFEAEPEEYAVAVLDATLRGMSTQELALRLLEGNSSIRVVVASGYPVDLSSLEAAAQGRVEFVQKPFSGEMLAQTMRRLLGPEKEDV